MMMTMEPTIPDNTSANKDQGFWADTKRLLSFDLSWSERTVLEKSYTGLFVMMLIGLFPMPYNFYESLRVITCIALYFFFQAVLPERKSRRRWFIIIVGLLILYNPIIPVRIGDKEIWTLVNLATLYLLYRARLRLDHK